jgi:chromosomal replication initiator protein
MIHYYAMPGIKNPLLYRYDDNSINAQVDLIFDTVCAYFGISKKDILSKTRKREIVIPRQILIYLIKEKCSLTLKRIGKIFSCDHTTIIHSCNRVLLIMDERLNYPEKTHLDKILNII